MQDISQEKCQNRSLLLITLTAIWVMICGFPETCEANQASKTAYIRTYTNSALAKEMLHQSLNKREERYRAKGHTCSYTVAPVANVR